MRLLGLELSDAGIIIAGTNPDQLLEIDGRNTESPGYALPEKNHLMVGKAAEKKAHIYPRLITSHFWDQLNTEPLDHPGPYIQQNHAEIASIHLGQIWESVKARGDAIIIAVPGSYHQDQLGILLGIGNELGLPIKGFVPIALAASNRPFPQKALFHLDIHLHRTEIVPLNQGEQLTCEDPITIAEKGLADLFRQWVEAVAAEFVRTTRFDPLHNAISEQELFDRLPVILIQLQNNSAVDFEMAGGSGSYRITLTRELLIKKGRPLFVDIAGIIQKQLARYKRPTDGVVIQLAHRIACLPGLKENLAAINDAVFIEPAAGAGAVGALRLWDQLSPHEFGQRVSFFTSRPWQYGTKTAVFNPSEGLRKTRQPSHILYKSLAYPLSETPLHIGLDLKPGESGIRIEGQITGVCRKHCSVVLRGSEAIVIDLSTDGTFVDDIRVEQTMNLQNGQIIRVGTPGETLQLIACLDTDET
jgi:hypothetical protein